jgi:hypothetical protein
VRTQLADFGVIDADRCPALEAGYVRQVHTFRLVFIES